MRPIRIIGGIVLSAAVVFYLGGTASLWAAPPEHSNASSGSSNASSGSGGSSNASSGGAASSSSGGPPNVPADESGTSASGGGSSGAGGGSKKGNGGSEIDDAKEKSRDASGEATTTLVLNQEQALDAVRTRRALPLEEIAGIARAGTAGELISAELIDVRGTLLYELRTLDASGVVQRLYYYARSGLPVVPR